MSLASVIHDNQHEMLDIVDDHDVVLFQTDKQDAYDRNLRKRIAHVIVIDPVTKRIGIQNRGLNISWQPGYYCTTACGHVGAGETWEQGAMRELEEEMGVTAELSFLGAFPYDCEHGKCHYLGIFTAEIAPENLKPDPHEVSALTFYTPEEVRHLIENEDKLQNHFKAVFNLYLQNRA